MEIKKIIGNLAQLNIDKIRSVDEQNAIHLQSKNHSISLALPKKIGSPPIVIRANIKLIFYYNKIKFFEKTFKESELASVFSIIEEWVVNNQQLAFFQQKYNIKIPPGFELLENDIRLYIQWKWDTMLDKHPEVSSLGYQPLFELIKNSDLSKLFPKHPIPWGFSVSSSISGSPHSPRITLEKNGKYIIPHPTGNPYEPDCKEYDLENIFEEYRKFFPEKIDWATYPQE